MSPLIAALFTNLPSIICEGLEKYNLEQNGDLSLFESFLKDENQKELFILCRSYSYATKWNHGSNLGHAENAQHMVNTTKVDNTSGIVNGENDGLKSTKYHGSIVTNSNVTSSLEDSKAKKPHFTSLGSKGIEKILMRISDLTIHSRTSVNNGTEEKSIITDLWNDTLSIPWEVLQSKSSFLVPNYSEVEQSTPPIVMNQCLFYSIIKLVDVVDTINDVHENIICIHIPLHSAFKAYHQMVTHLMQPHLKKHVEQQNRKNTDVIQSLEQFSLSLYGCLQEYNIPKFNLSDYVHSIVLLEPDKFVSTPQLLDEISDKAEKLMKKLNELSTANLDVKDITSSTKEIEFWKLLQSRMELAVSQPVKDTAAILLQSSNHRHSHAGNSLKVKLDDIEQILKRINEYLSLLGSAPIRKLKLANNINELMSAISQISSSLGGIKKNVYPRNRFSAFLTCIGEEIKSRVTFILKDIMALSYSEFLEVVEMCQELFALWRKDLVRLCTDAGIDKASSNLSLTNLELSDRINRIATIRKEHHDFQNVIDHVFTGENSETKNVGKYTSQNLNLAYNILRSRGNLLEESVEGFEACIKEYNEEVDKLDNIIVRQLKDEFGMAKAGKSNNEIFRVFRKYNSLFYRPKILESVQEYQEELISMVDSYIKSLDEKFKSIGSESEIQHLTLIYDVPPVSSSIIWAMEIERQLDTYIQRLDDVFGVSWERLLLLRVDGTWPMNESLAECIGVDYDGLKSRINRVSEFSKLHSFALGTAIAWAHLTRIYDITRPEFAEIKGSILTFLDSHANLNSKLNTSEMLNIANQILNDHGVNERHAQERDLRIRCADFKRKIRECIDAKLNDWYNSSSKLISRLASYESHIFVIEKRSKFDLKVNFSSEIIDFVKEGRFLLTTLQNEVERNPTLTAIHTVIVGLCPLILTIRETTSAFLNILSRMNIYMRYLLDDLNRNVAMQIEIGLSKTWKIDKEKDDKNKEEVDPVLFDFSRKFSRCVHILHERFITLDRRMQVIEASILKIENNQDSVSQIREFLQVIQHEIDESNLANFINLNIYVENLNSRIGLILRTKLEAILNEWNYYFLTDSGGNSIEEEEGTKFLKNILPTSNLKVSIKFESRHIFSEPSEGQVRMFWLELFHSCISSILSLPLLQSERYDTALTSRKDTISTFAHLQSSIPKEKFEMVYFKIDEHMNSISMFIQEWRNNQTLWDLTDVELFNLLGDDISKWIKMIDELIEGARSSESNKTFGRTTIYFEDVSKKIRNKYNATLQTVFSKFQSKMNNFGEVIYRSIIETKDEISKIRVEANIDNAILYLTQLLGVQKHYEQWRIDVFQYINVSKLLSNHLVTLDLPHEQLEGVWEELNQIIEMKNAKIAANKSLIIAKVNADDEDLSTKLRSLETEWKLRKNDSEHMTPEEALKRVKEIEDTYKLLKEREQKVHKAQEILDLEVSYYRSTINPEKSVLQVIGEEIENLVSVWSCLRGISNSIENVRDQLFQTVIIRQLKEKLLSLLEDIKTSPTWMHSYQGFKQSKITIESYLKSVPILSELKTDAMADRHWKSLRKSLDVEWQLSELTLGQLWDSNIEANEHIYKDILRVAQGELVLEVHLREIKEKWSTYQLELTNYHNKCFLIKDWDDLFDEATNHLNSLGSMRSSPYFKSFKEECTVWENNLNQVRVIFDLWLDVQRTWVYLEGIYTGNKDVKQQLPAETAKFNAINKTFKDLMRKVQSNPLALEVISIPNCEKSLASLSSQLQRVQKALGEYLEKQRAAFPRFYFVGDEDLLEIIGNADDPQQIQKHLKKMFAGIASLKIENSTPNSYMVLEIASQENERIQLKKPVEIQAKMRINEWLTALDVEVKNTLASILEDSLAQIQDIYKIEGLDLPKIEEWISSYPAQIIVLTIQIRWTQLAENCISTNNIVSLQEITNLTLDYLAGNVLSEAASYIHRKKYEYLITELVHQRDVIRLLMEKSVTSISDFDWLYYMRFYFYPNASNVEQKVRIQIANATFSYGFEYLGIFEKLVQTPLTDRCYAGLSQALNSRLGGSPFGPAGTGKTETVKSLANAFGRFVLVFCCDENFDYKAMGRIFVGICMCGAWGCFDEFNRLQENILSAVSQQILSIQTALKHESYNIELIERQVRVSPDTGIFITMNPGYAGRSNLPDNLKQLFRSIAMVKPDKELIAQVILYSHGFSNAEVISSKVVLFFASCSETLSSQSHYDFGLRALKTVLVNAGMLKRRGSNSSDNIYESEQSILIQSIVETMTPKLVAGDTHLLRNLVMDIFPNVPIEVSSLANLRGALKNYAENNQLICTSEWEEKVVQLYQIQNLSHGVILVGPAGCGKTACWRGLVSSIEEIDKMKSNVYIIDPKAVTKNSLFGFLDSTTREWTDGIFTHILRKVVDSVRGEQNQRHWIVFDGDVDPEWVENLNSVLDDNKLFTLPNGERLSIPNNVRLLFEVRNLDYATLATVSRCGMIWFSSEVVTINMRSRKFLNKLKFNVPEDVQDKTFIRSIQEHAASILEQPMLQLQLLEQVALFSEKCDCIMDFNLHQALDATFDLIMEGISNVFEYNTRSSDFPLSDQTIQKYIEKRFIFSLFWGFGSIMTRNSRRDLSEFICRISSIASPEFEDEETLLDYTVSLEDGSWSLWKNLVQPTDLSQQRSSESLVSTPDTLRHEELLVSWIHNKRNAILCGPPGSGKTMIMTAVMRSLANYDSVALNFSSNTGFDLILKTLEQYCTVSNLSKGFVMKPKHDRKLIIFCDEINLPANDKYGTQLVVTFMRQVIEQNGFWRASDHAWIHLENIIFVGACNPPTDPGRVIMTPRFLRHCPVLFVDFPSKDSLLTIYDTFNKSLFSLAPSLVGLSRPTTEAMVEIFERSQKKFTPDMQPHYIYSPRELSRWVRALQTVFTSNGDIQADEFVKLLVHEGLRIFADRLVHEEERLWTEDTFEEVVCAKFNVDSSILKKPILFSSLLTKTYSLVEEGELRDFLFARLHTFSEEELEVKLVLFDSVLEHILRIDRVLKQPLGHMLLAGASGAGKTILSKFVSWLNGYSVFQIKAHNNYILADFEEDLREILRRSGCKREKICFIFDEANALESSFLEYMNALLASGEVPGLFEDTEMINLINLCRSEIRSAGIMNIETDEEIYQWFVKQVQHNLHVVFTINPANAEFKNRAATSPALFNRCVVDWFGDWSQKALLQVAAEYTKHLPLSIFSGEDNEERHSSLSTIIVSIHNIVRDQVAILNRISGKKNFITPRHYLDFLHHFLTLHKEKMLEVQEQQLHINRGLQALKETEAEVSKLQVMLNNKKIDLAKKNKQADEKLKIIVKEKQLAQTKKDESMALATELNIQSEDINQRKAVAEEDLMQVQPQLEEAQAALKDIKKRHLDELRNLANPPDLIKATLEAVCIMLKRKWNAKYDWATIRKLMRSDSFIKDIIEFDSSQVDEKMRQRISKEFLPDLPYDAVRRASVACGPMVKWMHSQISYSIILAKVDPLKKEVEELEIKTSSLRMKQEELETAIQELEKSITNYEVEYEQLLKDTQHIKLEIDNVNTKVERSVNLLKSLASETVRWYDQSKSFDQQRKDLLGSVLLSSAFLTYIGQFDEYHRILLERKWNDILDDIAPSNFDSTTYLLDADKKNEWQSNGLPADNLCTQNAIIMEKFNRCPLIIDPTGQGVEFLMNQMKFKKIVKTSFLDTGFLKNLEACLRWGTPLLVQDAENLDPILNPILNKEFRKVGGRTLVGIGSQDIDVSESFSIYMSTRDPTYSFPADLASRVTFVNFTVTPSSLQAQCLGIILQHERPEIEKQRVEQLKLQSQYKLKQRALETSLLKYISEAKGNLLENEELISTLEHLKHSALDIQSKVEQVDIAMNNLAEVSTIYTRLSSLCSKSYFAQEQLQEIHFLYQFSVNHFMSILDYILKSSPMTVSDTDRVNNLSLELFTVLYARTSRSMRHKDQLSFALRLAQIFIEGTENEIPAEEFELLLTSGVSLQKSLSLPAVLLVTTAQRRKLVDLSQLSSCLNLEKHINDNVESWQSFLNGVESALPDVLQCFTGSTSNILLEFRKILLINLFIPSLLDKYCYYFLNAVFGDALLRVPELNIAHVIEHDQDCYTPLLLVSMPGYDPSEKIRDASLSLHKPYKSIAMGTSESHERANLELKSAMQKGTWIHLKNVHLSSGYLSKLEKFLHTMKLEQKVHEDFRLLLTSELHHNLPTNMLSLSYVILYETPTGIKANLTRSFTNLEAKQVDRIPTERSRLYLLLAWLHALIIERQRYIPMGWSKMYEFSEVDLKWAFEIIDTWVDKVAGSQVHVKPEDMPWKAITRLLSESVYGAKIDNEFDQQILQSIIDRLFVPASYHPEFNLVAEDTFTMPEDVNFKGIMKWIDSISPSLPPHYLGLPSNVKTMIQKQKAKDIIRKLAKISNIIDDQVFHTDANEENQNMWKKVGEDAQHWLTALPVDLNYFKFEQYISEYSNDLLDPILRSVHRELHSMSMILKRVRSQLSEIVKISQGSLKPNNTHWILRDLMTKQIIPRSWNQFTCISNLTVSEWILDFSARVTHLSSFIDHICAGKKYENFKLWLGGLQFPSAFLSATRQFIAEEKRVSLESLEPRVIFGEPLSIQNERFFSFHRLTITGAYLENNSVVPLSISDVNASLHHPIEDAYLVWVVSDSQNTKETMSEVPIYLNANRDTILLVISLPIESSFSIYERGIAITAWSQD